MRRVLRGLVAIVASAAGQPDGGDVPIVASKIPAGYRDWKLISVAHEAGPLNDLRAILGNDAAVKAYREASFPFPNGTMIARLAWSFVPSAENNNAFGRPQSFVAGSAKEGVQFMVKDTSRYASTGGWGFAEFDDGVPVANTALTGCFSCHAAASGHDFVFTRYAP